MYNLKSKGTVKKYLKSDKALKKTDWQKDS